MKKLLGINLQFIKFLWIFLLFVGISSSAFGATFTVTKIADTNDNVCDADCSLREAIAAANLAATDDLISFNPTIFAAAAQIITLNGTELSIVNNGTLTVNGTGAHLLSISGNNQSRVFFINTGANVTFNDLTITKGNSGIGNGGGISKEGFGSLVINNSNITGNSAGSNTMGGDGGGIWITPTNSIFNTASINNSNISNNFAGGGAGGIGIITGTLTVTNSTIGGNTSRVSGGGGLSIASNVTVNLTASTVSGNKSLFENGGGISNLGTLNITNVTVSGNSAGNSGGGIYNTSIGKVTLTHVTVSNNQAGATGGGGDGGGIRNSGFSTAFVNVRNTIIADNFRGSTVQNPDDFRGSLTSLGYNLIETTNNTIFSGSTDSNILGQDPQLLPLNFYNGQTQTQPLRATSPAVDKGNNFDVNTDQRGRIRPFDNQTIANATGGDGSDIGAIERQAIDVNSITFFDFDGDGKSDVSTYRPDNGTWYLQQSTNGFTGVQFGVSTDKIVPADYDGDGKTDVVVFRNGTWYLQRSQAGFTGISFGDENDIPVPADYDGDGKADVAVFRPSNGVWYIQRSQLGFIGILFGQTGDKPVPADYDGDGKADIAVYRNGTWYIQRSQLGFIGIAFGESTDKPVPADYDGDGKTDIAVFRPSNGTWYLQCSQLGFTGMQFGLGADLPVPADYDGDGKTDVAVFRDGTWYLNRSTAGFTGVSFGAATDNPVPNAFIP